MCVLYATRDTMELTVDNIRSVLSDITDPEIGIDLVSLGLIYEITVKNNRPTVKMTLTTPTCPLANVILGMVDSKLKHEFNAEPDIVVVFEPPWTPEMMSDEAKRKLGYKSR